MMWTNDKISSMVRALKKNGCRPRCGTTAICETAPRCATGTRCGVRFQQKITPTDMVLLETLLPAGSCDFGGSPRTELPRVTPDLTDTPVWPLPARRDFPFRPYLHARILRNTVVEQLPQIITIIQIIIIITIITIIIIIIIINIAAAGAVDQEFIYIYIYIYIFIYTPMFAPGLASRALKIF